MDKPLIIVGTGMQAEETHFYFSTFGGRAIDAFVLDPEYLREPTFLQRPVLEFAEARRRFPPRTHDLYVAIGMMAMDARRRWFLAARDAGYTMPSFVHPTALVASNVTVGANTVIKEMAVVAPFAQVGDDLIVCQQASIGHHARVGDHCFLAPATILSGAVEVGERCFLGTGCVVRDRVRIGDGCIIGAGAVVMGDCPPGGVYRAARTVRTREVKP